MQQERWEKFTKREQLGHISSELLRASSFENNNEVLYRGCLERVIDLVIGSLCDPKWKSLSYNLLFLHSELAQLYTGEKVGVLNIYNAL